MHCMPLGETIPWIPSGTAVSHSTSFPHRHSTSRQPIQKRTMFNNPAHAVRWQPPPLPPQASHATLCSLRGESRPHPLRQNPPSIRGSFDEAVFEDIHLAPPPSALTSTHYDPEPASPLDDYNSATRGHQRSLTDTLFENCRPLVTRATSSLQQTSKTSFHSPTKSLASFIPSRSAATTATSEAEAHAGQVKPRGTKIFSDWFNGSSAPVVVGVAPPSPTKDHANYTDDEEDEDEEQHEGTEDTTAMPTHTLTRPPPGARITTTTVPAAAAATKRPTTSGASNPTSKFSWLLNANKPSTPSQPTTSTTTLSATNYHNPTDPLLTLSISHALFPHDTIDPLAPSSFHDLLSTAEALLSRYQTSYRTLSTALADARAEQSALADELDEADTRVRCLKTQLADSAARAVEQDAQMARLAAEVRRERERRREDEEHRKRSVALIRGPACRSCAHSPLAREPVVVHTEEERETPRAAKRISGAGSCVSDSGFESEGESEAGSVFSSGQGAVSPVGTALSSVGSAADLEERERERERSPIAAPRPRPLQRRSTYDKVRAGLAHEVEGRGWGCANCEGGAQSAVWGRLAKEREQNGVLKRRVQELEGAVEGCLDLVNGPWGLGGL